MAVTFKIPSSPKRNVAEIDNFLGVDLTNTGSNVSELRSPNAPNMIRDVPGKVRKRMGYRTIPTPFQGEGILYGVHRLKNTTTASVMRKNICSARGLTYSNLEAGESVYLYSNNCCLPVGSTVHIQFYYKTTGAISISPYYESLEPTALNSINTTTSFYKNYTITEATNAFIITNNSSGKIRIELSDIMIYFVNEPEAFNQNYSSYTEINETRIYALGTDHDESPKTEIITGECEIAINPNMVKGYSCFII